MDKQKPDQDSICCIRFDPEPWDDKIIKWDNKRFIKDKVFTLFYIPINYGAVMTRLESKVTTKNDFLCLSEHTSLWNMNVYLAVDKEVAGSENVTMNGTFFSKVYEGDFNKTGEWTKDFESITKGRGFITKKLYMWYTTCPKCAKKYGKNYTVFIAEI